MWREHARFAPGFRRGQHNDPEHRARGQRVDVRRLAIRRDHPLQFLPELVHRTEFRRLLGQPHQLDPQPGGQRPRRRGGVRTRAVEHQPDRAGAAVAPPQFHEEGAGVGAAGVLPREHDAVRGADVDPAEEHALRVLARDRHDPRRPHRGPCRAQRREEPQQRPVGDEDDVAGPHARSQATAESPFFCPR